MSDFNPLTPFRSLSQRSLVYPDHIANPDRSVLIRVKDLIDDYPERVPFDPRFPRPGRRGGSRPRGQGLPPESVPPVEPPTYPPPRPRPVPPTTGGPPPAPGQPPGGAEQCFVDGGQMVNSGILLTTDVQTTVGVSERLIGPAVVVQVGFFCFNAAASTTLRAIIKVSDDASNAGGEATSGDRLSGTGSLRDFHPWNQWEYLYPYVTITRPSFYLKFICISEAVLGALNWEFVVCLKRL